ncbi:MAG: ECF RNA polymerase sigma factor SigK [Ilumatobacteraceae bacterium]
MITGVRSFRRLDVADSAIADTDDPPTRAAKLMRRVTKGDEAAFAELYDLVSPAVYGVTKRVVRNSAQAEEVAQEVMVELWRTAARYDPARGSVFTWVMTLAHRRSVDRVRAEESHVRRDERVQESAPMESADVADEVLVEFDRARVLRAMDQLTEAQRQSIELAFFGGHTHAEISVLVDLPLGTVKTRIRDGLIRLRDALGERQ